MQYCSPRDFPTQSPLFTYNSSRPGKCNRDAEVASVHSSWLHADAAGAADAAGEAVGAATERQRAELEGAAGIEEEVFPLWSSLPVDGWRASAESFETFCGVKWRSSERMVELRRAWAEFHSCSSVERFLVPFALAEFPSCAGYDTMDCCSCAIERCR